MVQFDKRYLVQAVFSICSVIILSIGVAAGIILQEIFLEHLGSVTKVEGAESIGLDWEK